MTRLEAFEVVERAMGELKIRDIDGELIIPLMASPAVARFHGQDWESLFNDMYEERIPNEEYAKKAVEMIQQYGAFRQKLKIEKLLTELQREVPNDARKV